jgi:uncharacterized protein
MANQNTLRPLITWPLLPLPDGDGRLAYPSLEESVRQMIRIILMTKPGEQLMRPGFGAGLENFIGEPNTLTTRAQIRDLIMESLARWEMRIVLDRVDVDDVPDAPSAVRVEIFYRLKRTGVPQRVGLTMQMGK